LALSDDRQDSYARDRGQIMSDKAEKKPESASSAAPAEKKDGGVKPAAAAASGGGIGGMLTKTPVMLGGVMILEAVVLFAGFKFLGRAPKAAAGAELVAADEHGTSSGDHGDGKGAGVASNKKSVEIEVLSFRAPNKLSGRTFLYDVSIFAVARTSHEEAVKSAIADRKNLITDRVRTIIAQTDPEKLGGGSEPGLETLRRQVKYQLDQIVGEGLIDEVLVPRCIPFRTDY
jgi:flagellar basal body-associated protein FliL